jgi:hypothetical protein
VYFLKEIMREMHDVGKDGKDTDLPDLTASFTSPPKMLRLSRPFFRTLQALNASKVFSLSTDEHGNPNVWFPLKKATCGSKDFLNKNFPNGLPRTAVVDITGAHLNPEYLTQYVEADARLATYYTSQLALVTIANSAYTTQPPSIRTDQIPSAGNHLVHEQTCKWAASWSVDAALLEHGKVKGNKKIMTAPAVTNALVAMLDLSIQYRIDLGLAHIETKTLKLPKRHVEHIKLSDQCLLLAKSRERLFPLYEQDPERFGLVVGWVVPKKPEDNYATLLRVHTPGVAPLAGHGPGNVNPTHTHLLFESYFYNF